MNKELFGSEIKKLRKYNKITQIMVSSLTGVSQETMRRIENGLDFPSIATIEKLSKLYKIDLYKIMSLCHDKDSYFSNYVTQISELFKSGKLDELKILTLKMKEEFENSSYQNKEQILVYLDSIYNMDVFNSKDKTKSEYSLENVMQQLSALGSNYYISDFEFKLGIVYSMIVRRDNKETKSIEFLEHLLEKVNHMPYMSAEIARMKQLIAINIAFAYVNMGENEKSIETIDKVLKDKEMVFRLDDYFQLIYRKGVALHQMNDESYKEVFKRALSIIDNDSFRDIHDFYKGHLIKTNRLDA